MSTTLRSSLIRLAAAQPELRPHLLPLLASLSKRALSTTLTYGNKDRHGSFFLTSFAFGSSGPEDDKKFVDILTKEVLKESGSRRVKPRLVESKDGVLTVWWGGQTSFSSPNAQGDDDMDTEAYWEFEHLMDGAFRVTAHLMGLLGVDKEDHAAYVKAKP